MYRIIDTLCQILVDELLNKISGYDLLFPVRNFNCIFSVSLFPIPSILLKYLLL